jgi:hypothetical protein
MRILLLNASTAVRGTYVIDATFTSPDAKVFSTGITLIVINSCDSTVFPEAPTLLPLATTYYHG